MLKHPLCLPAALLLFLAGARPVEGATITQSMPYATETGDHTSVSFNQFDTTLGTLTKIEIAFGVR